MRVEPLMTTEEAMEYLRVSRRTMYNYRQRGLPCVYLPNGEIRYHKTTLDRMLLSKSHKAINRFKNPHLDLEESKTKDNGVFENVK